MRIKNSCTYSPKTYTQAWLTWLGIVLFFQCQAQHDNFAYQTYGLEVDADNVIRNAAALDAFYERLYQLQLSGEGRVNIVHIGDSHIQADYLTAIVRRNFQRHFGNAGRGLIVPLRVAGTNEPVNFKTVSDYPWKSKRCVFPEQPLPIGIGGVTIETDTPKANLQVFMNDLWLDYTFNRLTLFYENDERSFAFSVRDSKGEELGRIDPSLGDSATNHATISWDKGIDAVTIQLQKTDAEQSRAIVYGLMLEKSSNAGVLYHTIGVNGAKYKHYNEAAKFAEQTAALNPDLFIISLGTNESIDYPYMDKNFPGQIDELLRELKARNPMAAFVLVTPQDVFSKKHRHNPGIMAVRDHIIEYAVDNGLAFYDLFRAMGGEHSGRAWKEIALLSKDGIHLTKEGYEYQGNLLYHALLKGYNSYVPTRHP